MSLFFRSSLRLSGNHIFLGTYRDFNGWQLSLPSSLASQMGANSRITLADSNFSLQKLPAITPSAYKSGNMLRGSGIHGPENVDVLRLVLWNRLKHKRPQREIPSTDVLRDWSKLEVSCVWFTWAFLVFYVSLASYGKEFSVEHGHYPWVAPRTDGSKGEGAFWWFLE